MKPRVAFFSLACCEGCQLQVLNCEEELLDLLNIIDIVKFREAMTESSDDYDIAFIEGTVTRPYDAERVKKIRERAKVLVALGACAATGGVNMIKNSQDLEDVRKYVYGKKWQVHDTYAARPLEAVVKVDYSIHGCPIDRQDFLEIVKSLVLGRTPNSPKYAVCVECRLKENVCVLDKDMPCLGPVTRAGCDALCPSMGNSCEGCRGLVENPNVEATKDFLADKGLAVDDILRQFSLFCNKWEVK